MSDVILEVKNLKKYFPTPYGMVHAVDDVSLSIKRGQTLGLVGESGCGKSTIGRTILRLLEPTSGEVYFDGKDIVKMSKSEFKPMRKEMQFIFQDPYSSINPRLTVSQSIAEPLIVNKLVKSKVELHEKVLEYMRLVGLDERLASAYPHELDGGRRQRIGIARALALNPKFIICDEPVSALDVSIQAQILNLLQDLQEQLGLTYIFVTHDLSVVKHISDEIVVMYLGQLVEKAPADTLFENPLHPYTRALLSAIPVASTKAKSMKREILKGEITSPVNPAPGCRFAKRCNYATPECMQANYELKEVEKEHWVACSRVASGELSWDKKDTHDEN